MCQSNQHGTYLIRHLKGLNKHTRYGSVWIELSMCVFYLMTIITRYSLYRFLWKSMLQEGCTCLILKIKLMFNFVLTNFIQLFYFRLLNECFVLEPWMINKHMPLICCSKVWPTKYILTIFWKDSVLFKVTDRSNVEDSNTRIHTEQKLVCELSRCLIN